ncbi:P-loop containing nucleoside triphosphate hydrolase protein [Rhizoclosmatium globosum]|uniref:p-loop containing nucleoside triphosphate hydrolase protein n=1 Tax=Rhizoclosmatium globosum TaxID=329046 RepID=A0A1Y2BPH6_9FUNG|nr:P-loop containing nucleoside triphosphate hydrolase protein [Rhizoclosmatium globosum]|eukprot:ORY36648.1 P-loop containing nucleoside triphosphate hydrolase protein [Rhizoclosmatium globosum]
MDPTPRKQISWSPVTYVTVGWIYPLLSVGSKKPLTEEDLPLLTTHESASHSAKWLDEFTMEAADYSRSTAKDLSLVYALMPHVLGVFVFNGICSAINVTLSMSMSLMVGVITNYLNGIYTALTSAAYKKSFRLASSSRRLYPPGKINTLCTSDIKNVKMFIDVVNRAWSMPLQVIITLYLVSTLLKAATVTAAAVFIGIGLFLLIVRPKMMAAVKEYMKGQDKRTTLLREFLYGVKVVKYQALEEHVEAKISAAHYIWRLVELLFILIAQQQLTTPLTLATYGAIGNGNNMDPATVFVAFSLLNGLVGISSSLTGVITGVTQASASYKRIYEFLIAEEADISEFPISLPSSTESDASAILFEDASFTWESSKKVGTEIVAKPSKKEKSEKHESGKVEATDSDIFTLEGVNLSIKKGSLVAVVGATGSGKSSLLSAITGGMRKTGGQATVFGSVGYCPQDPWIISGSVQDNITLLDDSLNDACSDAVNACSLAKDLESLANGLGTQIGEKELIYPEDKRRELHLVTLDAHVGKEIFNGTISGPPMKGKTVVIATHLLHILPKTDHVLVMDQGKINQRRDDYQKNDSAATNKKEEATAEDRQVGNVSIQHTKRISRPAVPPPGNGLLLSAWTSNFLNFKNQMNYVYIYSAASVFGALLANIIAMMTLYTCVNGAIQFHDSALKGIMAAPMSFFDTQPIGRLLNRMTGDVASLDRRWICLDNLNANGRAAIATTLVLWIIAWQFIPISLVMIGIAVYMYQFYQKTYRELKRLNTIMQSPLAAHISETLTGLPTVLSYQAQNIFIERQMLWFMLRLRCLAALITLALTLLGVTGLLIMVNVEHHIVINDISVSIRSGEKIGVVGRTGSGKSTLMDAFFRLMEANKGTIVIDGEDIATLGLKKLRSGIQMIPQNPILFDGTVRSNLDPVGRYSDENIWYALECCGMKDYISTMSEKLESVVTEGGSNLSAGQRQLLCLAKVLLQKSKILIMDEATSIQDSMKTHFKDATVISIAHRLNTVAAFDRILVLNHGKVAEFEAPHLLLSRNSLFADMVDATGVSNASVIRDIAQDAYLKTH